MKIYRPEVARRVKALGRCERCKAVCGKLDPHHYANSRAGANLLRFVIIGHGCHEILTDRRALARAEGWQAQINGTFAIELPAIVAAEKWFREQINAQ